jgi:hypothetical protein
MVERIYVKAGSYDQFNSFILLNYLDRSRFRYISSSEVLKGLQLVTYIKIGTHYTHYDSKNIDIELRVRRTVELNPQNFQRLSHDLLS